MSVNNMQPLNQNNQLFGEYRFSDSHTEDANETNFAQYYKPNKQGLDASSYLQKVYSLPLNGIRANILDAENQLSIILSQIETVISNIYINPRIDPDLEQAHYKVWEELKSIANIPITKNVSEDIMTIQPFPYDKNWLSNPLPPPNYIPFAEIVFCERSQTLASRTLIKEFYEAVCHSSFSYVYTFRKIIKVLLNELLKIKTSIFSDFGEAYEDESEQQVAVQYDAWTKTTLHCAQRIAGTISSDPIRLPTTEVDYLTKEQATKFQAFFAIKLNATEDELNNIISSLERDMSDNADYFYNRYLSPSLRFIKDISNTLETDFLSTKFLSSAPSLSRELVIATNVINGNFAGIFADLMERFNIAKNKIDLIIPLCHEKRKYANYITQLSKLGSSKIPTTVQVKQDVYSNIFISTIIPYDRKNKYVSKHSLLSDLESDDHPQYLLKSGGVITGDISVQNGAKIDGINIANHSHTPGDGSSIIKAENIDFGLSENADINTIAPTPYSVVVKEFISDIVSGGLPVVDAIIEFEIPDILSDFQRNIEFEIVYTEIE